MHSLQEITLDNACYNSFLSSLELIMLNKAVTDCIRESYKTLQDQLPGFIPRRAQNYLVAGFQFGGDKMKLNERLKMKELLFVTLLQLIMKSLAIMSLLIAIMRRRQGLSMSIDQHLINYQMKKELKH